MLDEKTRREIRARLELVFRDRLKGVLLFGSQARDEARADSDLDLLILLERPVRLGEDLEKIFEAIYPLQLELDAPIHATPVPAEVFEAGEYGIYRRARREGVFL